MSLSPWYPVAIESLSLSGSSLLAPLLSLLPPLSSSLVLSLSLFFGYTLAGFVPVPRRHLSLSFRHNLIPSSSLSVSPLARFSSRSLSGTRSLRSPFLFRGAQSANGGFGFPREPANAGGTHDGFLNHFYANAPRPLYTCTHGRIRYEHCESTLVTRRAYVCENPFCQGLTLARQTLPLPIPTIFTLSISF